MSEVFYHNFLLMVLGRRLIEYLVVLMPTIQIVKFTICFSTNCMLRICLVYRSVNLIVLLCIAFWPPPGNSISNILQIMVTICFTVTLPPMKLLF